MRYLIAITSMLVVLLNGAGARTWHVPADAPTIQAGIDSSAAGDTVLVACDTYYERDITIKSGVCLRSATGLADCVTIDAQRLGRVLYCDAADSTTRIEGFTIRHGQSLESPYPSTHGGGIYCENSSPVISDCILSGNMAGGWMAQRSGGGFYCVGSSPTLVRVTFAGNSAGGEYGGTGGGMYCSSSSSLSLTQVTFYYNRADGAGAGMYLRDSDATLSDVIFLDNHGGLLSQGGGMYCYHTPAVTFTNCTFAGNGAGVGGGGMFCNDSAPLLMRCTFYGNRIYGAGAGIYCQGQAAPSLENVIVAFSEAGSAVHCGGSGIPSLTCCDIYGNDGGDWVGCIADQYGINGNFSLDPDFCDPYNGDFHLWNYSPCVQIGCGQIGAWPVGCWDPQGTEHAADSELATSGLYVAPAEPNPFTGSTSIPYSISLRASGDQVVLDTYDTAGRLVQRLIQGAQPPGSHSISWDGRGQNGQLLEAGIYLCRLRSGHQQVTQRVLLMR